MGLKTSPSLILPLQRRGRRRVKRRGRKEIKRGRGGVFLLNFEHLNFEFI